MSETTYEIVGETFGGRCLTHSSRFANDKAEYAKHLMEHHATVCAVPDGEDTAGRSKLRLQTPAEVVDRCVEIADRAYAEFEKRGWLVAVPSMDALREEADKREEAHEKRREERRASKKAVVQP
jgi:hypothetical protein